MCFRILPLLKSAINYVLLLFKSGFFVIIVIITLLFSMILLFWLIIPNNSVLLGLNVDTNGMLLALFSLSQFLIHILFSGVLCWCHLVLAVEDIFALSNLILVLPSFSLVDHFQTRCFSSFLPNNMVYYFWCVLDGKRCIGGIVYCLFSWRKYPFLFSCLFS